MTDLTDPPVDPSAPADPWFGDLDAASASSSTADWSADDDAPAVERDLAEPLRAARRLAGSPMRRPPLRRSDPDRDQRARELRAQRTSPSPARRAWGMVRSHHRFHRTRRLVVGGGLVALIVACSVGVIMLNNVVIRRSAELGRLEHSRKQLRTENALLGARIARLGAPPRIAALARRRLGMERPVKMPPFIWLDPNNRPITEQDRRRAARRAARRARAAATAQATPPAAAGAAAPPTATATVSDG